AFFALKNQHEYEEYKLRGKTNNAAAGSAQKKSANLDHSKDPHDKKPLTPNLAEDQGNQGQRCRQLGECGEMVAVDIRTEGDDSVAHFAKPIECPVESKVLEDSKDGNDESKDHEHPKETLPVLEFAKRLRSKKKHQNIGPEELQLHTGRVRQDGQAKSPLRQRQ